MITAQTAVKHVGPGIDYGAFAAELDRAGSPAAPRAGTVYLECQRRGLDARFLLGMFQAESSMGTNPAAIAVKDNIVDGQNVGPTRSWGNTTEPSYGDPGLGPPFVRQRFTRYADWAKGGIGTIARLFEHPAYANAVTVEQIVSIWAPPVENATTRYIDTVLAVMNRLGGTMSAPEIIDVRNQLPTNPNQGSGQKRQSTQGQILHYSAVNYPDSRDILTIMQAEASYHITSALKEGGLAYHYVVDWRDGTIYQCRDEDAVLWHCGYWGPGGNGTGLAVHVPGGSTLVMSDAAVQSLVWLFGRNEQKYGFGRNMMRGHLEVSSTSCPGPLMDQIVHPYRQGTLNWGGGTMPYVDPVTGHTVHPDLMDIYDFNKHGRPLQPAVLYSDGVIRQLFERAILAPGKDGAPDTVETVGQALLYMTGEKYPEWPGVTPLV